MAGDLAFAVEHRALHDRVLLERQNQFERLASLYLAFAALELRDE